MMSDSYFHSSIFDFKIWMSYSRKSTRCKSNTYRTCMVNSFLCYCNYLIKISALCCLGTADFPHENLSGHTSSFFSLIFWCRCNIIIGNYCFNSNSYFFCHLHSHFYIHVVSRIISIKAGNAFSLICFFRRIQKCYCSRGRTDFPYCCCIAEIFSYIANESWFMT